MPAKSIFYVYRFCLTTITLSQAVKSNIYKLMGYLLNFVSFLLFFYWKKAQGDKQRRAEDTRIPFEIHD